MTNPYPESERAIRSLLVAPLLPVGILFLFDAIDRVMQFGLLYAFGAALFAFYVLIVVEILSFVLGGAMLAILWKRIPFNFFLCALIGGFVASLPFLLMYLLPANSEPISYNAWVDGKATVINGVKTSYGHWQDVLAIIQIFGFGCVGGAFFWWLCRPKLEPEDGDR